MVYEASWTPVMLTGVRLMFSVECQLDVSNPTVQTASNPEYSYDPHQSANTHQTGTWEKIIAGLSLRCLPGQMGETGRVRG